MSLSRRGLLFGAAALPLVPSVLKAAPVMMALPEDWMAKGTVVLNPGQGYVWRQGPSFGLHRDLIQWLGPPSIPEGQETVENGDHSLTTDGTFHVRADKFVIGNDDDG